MTQPFSSFLVDCKQVLARVQSPVKKIRKAFKGMELKIKVKVNPKVLISPATVARTSESWDLTQQDGSKNRHL